MADQSTDGFKIQLRSLHLERYKQFLNARIDFTDKPSASIFIADNGGGKTTMLDATAEALRVFLAAVLGRDFKPGSPRITSRDIKLGSGENSAIITLTANVEYPVRVITQSKSDENNSDENNSNENNSDENNPNDEYAYELRPADFEFRIAINQRGKIDLDISNLSNPDETTILSDVYESIFQLGVGYLPVLVYYGGNPMDNIPNENISNDLESIYRKALDPERAAFSAFSKWFEAQYVLSKLSRGIIEKEKAEKKREIIVKCIEKILNAPGSHTYREPFMNYHDTYREFAIEKQNPADEEYEIMEFTQLSAGEKNTIAIVADLARRIILANPNSDNPLEGNGIVLIDEIDQHLHPKWQQQILSKLREIFPNIHFMVTTHSPFVVSSYTDADLGDKQAVQTYRLAAANIEEVSYGMGHSADYVLSEVMEVDILNTKIEEYIKLIHSKKHETQEGKKLKNWIDSHIDPNSGDAMRLNFALERFKAIRK